MNRDRRKGDPAGVRGVKLYTPRAIEVTADEEGLPTRAAGVSVDVIREEWLLVDEWWTGVPVRRRYFELALLDGRNMTVFCDLGSGRWFAQRA
jgi:hypothetical protein